MKTAPRPYMINADGNHHMVRVERWDTSAQLRGKGTVTLSELISDMYYVYFEKDVYKHCCPIDVRVSPSDGYKGEQRAVILVPLSEKKGSKANIKMPARTIKIKAYINDVFILQNQQLVFIPAEVAKGLNIMHSMGLS